MTDRTIIKQVKAVKWQGGTRLDHANFEAMRREVVRLNEELRALRKRVPKSRYPDPTYRPPGLRLVHGEGAV